MAQTYIKIYLALRARFGHRNWWPAETPFEVLVGAILTQNTNWRNVETAIAGLKSAGCLTPAEIVEMPQESLGELIKPAGYYRLKAGRLKVAAGWVEQKCGNDPCMAELKVCNTEMLREALLELKGIGPETADSILLYALDRPVFVVDTYTARVFGRHGLIFPGSGYADIQSELESSLPNDVELFKDYHAQLVEVGKRFCKKSSPACVECPLHPVLEGSYPN